MNPEASYRRGRRDEDISVYQQEEEATLATKLRKRQGVFKRLTGWIYSMATRKRRAREDRKALSCDECGTPVGNGMILSVGKGGKLICNTCRPVVHVEKVESVRVVERLYADEEEREPSYPDVHPAPSSGIQPLSLGQYGSCEGFGPPPYAAISSLCEVGSGW